MLPPEATHGDIEEKLSKLLGIIPHFLDIKGERGGRFVSCAHLPSRKLTVSLYGRGGMRAGQTDEAEEGGDENYDNVLDDPEVQQEENNPEVADENYWDHDDDYDPAHEQEVWEEHVNEIMNEPTPRHRERSRSRNGRVLRAHRRGVHWADQGEDLDAYAIWSPVWPRSPPSAQPDRAPKPLLTDGIEIGRIMAAPRALLSQVLAEFAISHKFECLIHVEPMGAVEWRQVESLGVEAPRPRTSYHLDLREGPWERYQSIRHVPVLIDGMPVDTVLFPWHLPIHLAQARLDDDTHVQQNWMMCAVNTDNWVIVRWRIPSSILEDLDDLETYRQKYRLPTRLLSSFRLPPELKNMSAFRMSSRPLKRRASKRSHLLPQSLAKWNKECNSGKRLSYHMCWRGYPSQFHLARMIHSRMQTSHSPMRTRVVGVQGKEKEKMDLQGTSISKTKITSRAARLSKER